MKTIALLSVTGVLTLMAVRVQGQPTNVEPARTPGPSATQQDLQPITVTSGPALAAWRENSCCDSVDWYAVPKGNMWADYCAEKRTYWPRQGADCHGQAGAAAHSPLFGGLRGIYSPHGCSFRMPCLLTELFSRHSHRVRDVCCEQRAPDESRMPTPVHPLKAAPMKDVPEPTVVAPVAPARPMAPVPVSPAPVKRTRSNKAPRAPKAKAKAEPKSNPVPPNVIPKHSSRRVYRNRLANHVSVRLGDYIRTK